MNINKRDVFLDVLEKTLKNKKFDIGSDFIANKQDEICQNIQNDYITQLLEIGIKNADANFDGFYEHTYDNVFDYIVNYVSDLVQEINTRTGFQLSTDQIKDFLANISEYDTLDEQLDNVLGIEF